MSEESTKPSSDPTEVLSPKRQSSGYHFGTFKGVFTPNILTILGVVMYLRFGWVLGHAGLSGTLLIVTLSTLVTALTALSISALATNMRIGGGGAYYILSRSLGMEAGAAVGLPLFMAQAFSISFYIAGFSESIVGLLPWVSQTTVGLGTLVVLAGLAYCSANLALKAQFFILALIVISLISFFLGSTPQTYTIGLTETLPPRESFWTVFAVFFPAVTGIQAGLAMSGDLKNPARALPLGTLGAVLASYGVYIAIPIFLSQVIHDRQILLVNTLIMRDVALWGNLILYGLWGAALSSALGVLLGAPRTLQALARDGIAPRILSLGFGKNNEPRLAVLVSFGIGMVGILAGGINVIAPMLSMFFLISYGLLNLAAALEGMIGSPSWRPAFRVPWGFSLLGAILCLLIALMINPGAVFAATLFCGLVYFLMRRRKIRAYWGDMRYGILMLMARFALYRLSGKDPNVRTWRPNILVLSGSPTSRWYLVALADAISHGKGFLTVAAVVPRQVPDAERSENMTDSIEEYLKKRQVPALVRVEHADDVLEGAQSLIQTYGFGSLVPNTVLLGETEKSQQIYEYVRLIRLVYRMRKNLIIVRESDAPPSFEPDTRIDLWWSHDSNNAGLMLALGYLLKTSPEWLRSRLVLKTVVDSEEDREEATKGLGAFLKRGRVEADVEILVRDQGSVFEMIRKSSRGAGMIFLGMRPPQKGDSGEESEDSYTNYYERLIKNTDGLPSVAIVLAAEEMDFDHIFDSPA